MTKNVWKWLQKSCAGV